MPAEVLRADAVGVSLDQSVLLPPTSLRLVAGESVAVLGENGAGKTTLLRAISGRIRVTSGAVLLRGVPIREARREQRSELSALIDPPTLYPDLTIRDNLAVIEAAWSGWKRPLPGLGSRALDVFGISQLEKRFPNELSSGQRQLVSLAVTFARPASVLILDEPEQRLDPQRRERVAQAMLDANQRGIAIVFASHDPLLVDRTAQSRVSIGAQ